MVAKRFEGQKNIGLAVVSLLLLVTGTAFAADDDVNVYDFRARKADSAPENSGFVPVDGAELDRTSKALRAAEEELMQKLADGDGPSNSGAEMQKPLQAKSQSNIEEALQREAEILAQLEQSNPAKAAPPAPANVTRVKAEDTTHSKPAPVVAKVKKVNISERMKNQNASLKALHKSKKKISGQISAAERRMEELIRQLEDAQNRLMIAETEVERLNEVIETRNIQNLQKFQAKTASRGGNRNVLKPAKVVKRFGDKEITTDMPIATVVVKKANLRTGPGLNNSPLMTVSRGTRLAIESRKGEWYRVIAPSGTRAWVSTEVVRFGKDNLSSPSRTVKVKGYDASVEEEAIHLIRRGS